MPERLPEAGAGRVLGRGHVHVVAAQVLDLETLVADAGQQHAASPGLQPPVLVDQFVRGVDRQDAADQSLRKQPACAPHHAVAGMYEPVRGPRQQGQVHGQGQQGERSEPK